MAEELLPGQQLDHLDALNGLIAFLDSFVRLSLKSETYSWNCNQLLQIYTIIMI